jgi:transposase
VSLTQHRPTTPAKAQLKRAKNDVLDAQTIAELAQALVPTCWTPPPQIYDERKPRLSQRASFLELRTQFLNQLHALSVSPIVVAAVRGRLEQLVETINQQITELDTEILELVKVRQEISAERTREETGSDEREVDTKWKAAIALLVTIPGIGLLRVLLVGGRHPQLYPLSNGSGRCALCGPCSHDPEQRSKCAGSSADWP